jgi:hypothetical protein
MSVAELGKKQQRPPVLIITARAPSAASAKAGRAAAAEAPVTSADVICRRRSQQRFLLFAGTPPPFTWDSLHGASVGIFLAIAGLYALIGAGSPFAGKSRIPIAFFAAVLADEARAVGSTGEALFDDPIVLKLRVLLFNWIGGLFVMSAVLKFALTWWGVREGHVWALYTLILAHATAAAFAVLVVLPAVRATGAVRFSLLPPLLWLPPLAATPAAILGWLALR